MQMWSWSAKFRMPRKDTSTAHGRASCSILTVSLVNHQISRTKTATKQARDFLRALRRIKAWFTDEAMLSIFAS